MSRLQFPLLELTGMDGISRVRTIFFNIINKQNIDEKLNIKIVIMF